MCFPDDGAIDNRLSLADVVTFAIWKGITVIPYEERIEPPRSSLDKFFTE